MPLTPLSCLIPAGKTFNVLKMTCNTKKKLWFNRNLKNHNHLLKVSFRKVKLFLWSKRIPSCF